MLPSETPTFAAQSAAIHHGRHAAKTVRPACEPCPYLVLAAACVSSRETTQCRAAKQLDNNLTWPPAQAMAAGRCRSPKRAAIMPFGQGFNFGGELPACDCSWRVPNAGGNSTPRAWRWARNSTAAAASCSRPSRRTGTTPRSCAARRAARRGKSARRAAGIARATIPCTSAICTPFARSAWRESAIGQSIATTADWR